MGTLILLVYGAVAIWLIRRDSARRIGVSAAVWIPTLWVGVLVSRPLSAWLQFGGSMDSLEGSPLDRAFFFALIFLSWIVLIRRKVSVGRVIAQNWPIFLYYGFFLVSVLWSDSTVSSFKRWFKDVNNIAIILVICTEANPLEALRAMFTRYAIAFFPLSIIFFRYFPSLGRRYSQHSGEIEAIGVSVQKNSLGVLVLVSSLIIIWDWLERSKSQPSQQRTGVIDRAVPIGLLVLGAWVLRTSDSKTSMLCLAMGTFLLLSPKLPVLRTRVPSFGYYLLGGSVVFLILNWTVGLSELLVSLIGRDLTFTGRTNVWAELLALNTDPLIGTGFCSFWDNQRYIAGLSSGIGASAHNGYLETYLDGGYLGLTVLAIMLGVVGKRINSALANMGNYDLFRFTIFLVMLIGNFSESHFGRMSSLWFLFLFIAIYPGPSIRPSLPRGAPALARPVAA